MTKDEVLAALEEIGTLLQLQGENDFRARAYSAAARTLSQYQGDFLDLVRKGKIGDVKGIGEALADKITALVEDGRLPYLEDLRASIPPGLVEMLRLPGIGPKKVKLLFDELQIDTLAKLQKACETGTVAELKGFGAKTQTKILEGLRFLDTLGKRVRIDQAQAVAQKLFELVRAIPEIDRLQLCGSLRRRRETAKDIDMVASSTNAEAVMKAFIALPGVVQVVNHGPTKSSIVVQETFEGKVVMLGADLRVVTEEQFPYAILHFTGSKEHNIRLRQLAQEKSWSLNEYDFGPNYTGKKLKTEADIYKALGLEFVEPELREDTGEVEASAKKALPELIEAKDLKGVFHNHTTASDGTASLKTMAEKCIELGWEYFGVGDHSQSLTVANGLNPERVRKQWAEIDELNRHFKKFRILKGIECDILLDGSLDYDDELLEGFDYVVASVHTHFNLSEAEQTARVCKALSHPATTMLGHATGRLLLRREGYKIDLDKVIRTAAEHGKMIEINAQPSRLDLDWSYVKKAKMAGVKLVINPDAHSPEELELVSYGIDVARRGWLTKDDVFNTLGLNGVLKALGV